MERLHHEGLGSRVTSTCQNDNLTELLSSPQPQQNLRPLTIHKPLSPCKPIVASTRLIEEPQLAKPMFQSSRTTPRGRRLNERDHKDLLWEVQAYVPRNQAPKTILAKSLMPDEDRKSIPQINAQTRSLAKIRQGSLL